MSPRAKLLWIHVAHWLIGRLLRIVRAISSGLEQPLAARWAALNQIVCIANAYATGTVVRIVCTVVPTSRCPQAEHHAGVWIVERWTYDADRAEIVYWLRRAGAPADDTASMTWEPARFVRRVRDT